MSKTRTTKTLKETTLETLSNEPTIPTAEDILNGNTHPLETQTTTTKEITHESTAENSLIEPEPEYLTADQLHEQLMSQGNTHDENTLKKIFELDQVIQALTAQKGSLNSSVDFVPIKEEDKSIIVSLNGGKWPQTRFVIYKNARICLLKDIPYIKAVDKLTEIDINHPRSTGKLEALKAL